MPPDQPSRSISSNIFVTDLITLFIMMYMLDSDLSRDLSSSTTTYSNKLQIIANPVDDVTSIDPVSQATVPPPTRQSTWVRELSHLHDYHCYSTIFSQNEPSYYKEVIFNTLWQQSMSEELQALEKAQTWEFVVLPPRKTVVGYK